MESQKKHIKFMAQKYLDSSQKKTPQMTSVCKRQRNAWSRFWYLVSRGHRGRETSGTPLFPDIYGGKKNSKCNSSGRCSRFFFIVLSEETAHQSDEKAQSRLQFVLNTDSPGPAAYSPPTMACRETIAPSYTFGWKTPPRGIVREGGGRRAWQKSWFMSKNPFWRKVDFSTETNWPSPSQYGQLLGTNLGNRSNTPNFTFGQRGEYCLINKGEMVPTCLLRGQEGIPVLVETPGPGAYNVDKGYNARLPRCPSFYIQGVRRPKKHETGPFSTL
ncbi:hypothetical protein E2320_006685 [Naja naja]|nr:hypothetical protein E2320_006685 [Naja naja]